MTRDVLTGMGKPATTVGFITQSLKPHGCLQALKEAKVRHGCHNYKAVSESVQADSKQMPSERGSRMVEVPWLRKSAPDQ